MSVFHISCTWRPVHVAYVVDSLALFLQALQGRSEGRSAYSPRRKRYHLRLWRYFAEAGFGTLSTFASSTPPLSLTIVSIVQGMKLMRGDMGMSIPAATDLFVFSMLTLGTYAGGAATVTATALAIAKLKVPSVKKFSHLLYRTLLT